MINTLAFVTITFIQQQKVTWYNQMRSLSSKVLEPIYTTYEQSPLLLLKKF